MERGLLLDSACSKSFSISGWDIPTAVNIVRTSPSGPNSVFLPFRGSLRTSIYRCGLVLRTLRKAKTCVTASPPRSVQGGVLALPDILTAGARNCLRGKFLFQEFLTSRTLSLPHIQTCLSPHEQAPKASKNSKPGFACLFLFAHIFRSRPVRPPW